MKRFLFFILTSIIVFASCSESADLIRLDIDNPTDKEHTVIVDSIVVKIPAYSYVVKKVERGQHSLTFFDRSTVEYNFDKDHYLVNPTKYDYLIEKIYYSKSGNPMLGNMFNKINQKTVTFLGVEITGNYEVFNDRIKERDWDFIQRQAVPESITIKDQKFNASKDIRKLFAADEFLKFLEEESKKR